MKTTIAKDIKRLEPQQRVAIFEKLLSYAVPKMQKIGVFQEFLIACNYLICKVLRRKKYKI